MTKIKFDDTSLYEYLRDPLGKEAEKQATPKGRPLPAWEGQPEITTEQVAEALRDWDAKAPEGWQGLLLT